MQSIQKVEEIIIGFHPDGYRIDKTASAMNRYTRWDITSTGKWQNPTPVCFDSLPKNGWIAKDKFNWDEPHNIKEVYG